MYDLHAIIIFFLSKRLFLISAFSKFNKIYFAPSKLLLDVFDLYSPSNHGSIWCFSLRGCLFNIMITVENVFFWLTRSKNGLQALSISQLEQFVLGIVTPLLQINSFLHIKHPCLRWAILIPSNDFVQSIDYLPEKVFLSDSDTNLFIFTILCSSL